MRSKLRNWVWEQLAMYAAYHRDRRNQATHHIGVPLIVFSLVLAFDQIGLFTLTGVRVSAGLVLLAGLILLYLLTIPRVGFLALIFYALVYAIVVDVPPDRALAIAAAGFVLGWAIQFIGHVFEGRRPALFVNLTQVFMAPAFLIAEMLFAVGAESGLAAELTRRATKYQTA